MKKSKLRAFNDEGIKRNIYRMLDEFKVVKYDKKRLIVNLGHGMMPGMRPSAVTQVIQSVRDYEKVQCYAYMFILDLQKVHLCECIKETDKTKMNIIDIVWDEDYWRESVVDKVSEFIDDFYDFLKDTNRKFELISN